MINKKVKMFAIALTLIAGGSIYGADRTITVINTINEKLSIDLTTDKGYSKNIAISIGQTAWTTSQDSGCLSSVKVNGDEIWKGKQCSDEAIVTIYKGWGGQEYGIQVAP